MGPEDAASRELERVMEGLCPLQRALLLVRALRKVYGGEWTISCDAGGCYTIEQQRK